MFLPIVIDIASLSEGVQIVGVGEESIVRAESAIQSLVSCKGFVSEATFVVAHLLLEVTVRSSKVCST